MTQTIQNPLSEDQHVRAAALGLAVNFTADQPYDTGAVLDLADYILGPPPCPLAGLKDPIFFDIDLGTVSHELVELMTGTAPAEPEVITVASTTEGFASLPVGSAVLYPAFGGRYVKVGPDDWRRIGGRDGLMGQTGCKDAHMATGAGVIAEYIPGGA